MWQRLIVLAFGCGHVGFDPTSDARDAAASNDASPDAFVLLDTAGLRPAVWFDFETPPGGSIPDIASQHLGSCVGAACPMFVTGRHGKGYQFDGVANCIVVPDNGQLTYPSFTLSVWANQGVMNQAMSIVEKRYGTGFLNSFQLETGRSPDPVDGVSFTSYRSGALNEYLWSGSNVFPMGAWRHIAARWDGTNKQLFINGLPLAPMAFQIAFDNGSMRIGCDDNAPLGMFYNGILDDIEIFDHALTDAEIARLAAN